MWSLIKDKEVLFKANTKNECVQEAIKLGMVVRVLGDWLDNQKTIYKLKPGCLIVKE